QKELAGAEKRLAEIHRSLTDTHRKLAEAQKSLTIAHQRLLSAQQSLAGRDRSADPLRLVPDKADLIVQVADPRKLIETALALDAFKQAQGLAPGRELIDSTQARRFFQLIAYYEKLFGIAWPALLDRLA